MFVGLTIAMSLRLLTTICILSIRAVDSRPQCARALSAAMLLSVLVCGRPCLGSPSYVFTCMRSLPESGYCTKHKHNQHAKEGPCTVKTHSPGEYGNDPRQLEMQRFQQCYRVFCSHVASHTLNFTVYMYMTWVFAKMPLCRPATSR